MHSLTRNTRNTGSYFTNSTILIRMQGPSVYSCCLHVKVNTSSHLLLYCLCVVLYVCVLGLIFCTLVCMYHMVEPILLYSNNKKWDLHNNRDEVLLYQCHQERPYKLICTMLVQSKIYVLYLYTYTSNIFQPNNNSEQ